MRRELKSPNLVWDANTQWKFELDLVSRVTTTSHLLTETKDYLLFENADRANFFVECVQIRYGITDVSQLGLV